MHIDISTQHTQLTDSLKSYIQEKFQKLESHASFASKPDLRAEVTLIIDDSSSKTRHRVEAELFGDRFSNKKYLSASSTTKDMYKSIINVVKHLDRQMRKEKTAKISSRDQVIPVKKLGF